MKTVAIERLHNSLPWYDKEIDAAVPDEHLILDLSQTLLLIEEKTPGMSIKYISRLRSLYHSHPGAYIIFLELMTYGFDSLRMSYADNAKVSGRGVSRQALHKERATIIEALKASHPALAQMITEIIEGASI